MLGFTNTMLEVIQKQKPTHLAIAFDTSAPTFRHETYVEYKANRQETPEDIRAGIPIVKDIIRAFNIPILERDGFEADDIIGTIAKKAARNGFEVFMMTPDKDYGQLVEEHIYLYKPSYMGNAVDIMGVEEIKKKWGIDDVHQVIDMLGLQGDASDNIPGIPGIGPKTATKLLKQYGSVENLVANADDLKGKQKENVINFGEQGLLSKRLATIITDVPVDFDEEAMIMVEPNEEKVKLIFEELEFRTLAKRLFGGSGAEEGKASAKATKGSGEAQLSMFGSGQATGGDEKKAPVVPQEKDTIATVAHHYHSVDTPLLRKQLATFLALQEEFCFDTETTSVDPIEAELVGIAFSYVKGEAYYVPVPEDTGEVSALLEDFKEVLESEHIMKIGQNIKYDILVLKKYGINVKGPLFDTMLAHYLLEPEGKHNMDVLAEQYLNYSPVSITTLIGPKGKKQKNMRDIAPIEVVEYAGEDADITLQLKAVLMEALSEVPELKTLLFEVELPLVSVLADMEFAGINIDLAALEKMSEELHVESRNAQDRIYELAGQEFNVASPKQLGEILFDKMKLVEKPKKTKTGQYATGEEILSKLADEHEIVNKILEFREYQKLKSTYVDALPKMISGSDHRVHTNYSQAVAATGRLSSNDPNLQNIPIRTAKGREIRKAFIPKNKDHILMAADYSQIELRIAASFAKDEFMIEAFRSGKDIHSSTASKVFKVPLEEVEPNMRRKAKEVNFGLLYGMSAFGLAERMKISRGEAKEIMETYFAEFSAIKKYMSDIVEEAKEKEYVSTIMGRRRYLRDINSRNATMRGWAERNAINAPIQGSAADIIKVAMIDIQAWMKSEKLKSKMLLQVHDELVFDVHRDEIQQVSEGIDRLMTSAVQLEVPMVVEIGTGANWLEAH